jgi:hypothetical protein
LYWKKYERKHRALQLDHTFTAAAAAAATVVVACSSATKAQSHLQPHIIVEILSSKLAAAHQHPPVTDICRIMLHSIYFASCMIYIASMGPLHVDRIGLLSPAICGYLIALAPAPSVVAPAHDMAKAEEQLATAETKAVQLEQELMGANAQVLEAKRGQLAAVRASRASEAAHKTTLQSKQWDRGKVDVHACS